MWTGNRKAAGLATTFVLVAVGLTACGSGSSDTPTIAPPALSVTTADHLAKLSDRIASDLDSGDLCHAAHAADDLHAAVEDSDLPANLRPDVDAVATDLVNQVNCPPPPPPPEPEKKKHEGEKKPHVDEKGSKPTGHGDKLPPGKAKLKVESG
jgi:hypothetical protein